MLVRRDTREKVFVSLDELETAIPAQLEGTLVQVLPQGLQLGGNGGLQLVQAHEHLLAGEMCIRDRADNGVRADGVVLVQREGAGGGFNGDIGGAAGRIGDAVQGLSLIHISDRDTPPSTAYPGRAIAEGSAGQEVGQVERWLNRRAQLSCCLLYTSRCV